MKTEVEHQKGHFQGAGGLDLYYQSWIPVSVEKKVRDIKPAVVLFIHGMAEHSDRYKNPIRYFTRRGYASYAMDLRGHGNSGGRRSYADSMDQLVEDLRSFVSFVKKHEKGKKIFLVGHSFGGQLVLNYGARHAEGVSGILVSSPNVSLRVKIPLIKRLAAPILSRIIPKLALGNELNPNLVSRDPNVVEEYRTDKRIQRKITTRLADIVLENHLYIMDLAKKFHVPTFLMHAGDDAICSPEGTRRFYENMPIRDKKFKIYPGFYHELFNELGRDQVFRDMELWILKRL